MRRHAGLVICVRPRHDPAAGPLRVHLRLEFHDEGNGKTRLELRQGPFATGQLGADTRSGWESSFTKLDTLLRASLAPDLGTRRP